MTTVEHRPTWFILIRQEVETKCFRGLRWGEGLSPGNIHEGSSIEAWPEKPMVSSRHSGAGKVKSSQSEQDHRGRKAKCSSKNTREFSFDLCGPYSALQGTSGNVGRQSWLKNANGTQWLGSRAAALEQDLSRRQTLN